MSWVTFAWPVAVTIAILAALGLPAALAMRLRGYVLLVVALPAGFAVLAASAIVAAMVGVKWSILPPLIFAVLLALALFVTRRWFAPSPHGADRPQRITIPLASAAIGGVAIAVALILSMKTADAVSQTYDANFHLNAVQYILDTGSASPLDMDLSAPGRAVFYPTLWHAIVALVSQLSGVGIPTATNAVLFVVCAVVWPIGAVALGRSLAGPSRRATLVSGILSAAFPSFPLILAGYGVLYPNLLSTSLLPYILVAFLKIARLGRARLADPLRAPARWLLLIGALGAAVLAHPNALHVALAWVAAPTVFALARYWRGSSNSSRVESAAESRFTKPTRGLLSAAGALVLVLVIIAAWYVGRTSDNAWEGDRDPLGAVIDLIGSTPRLEGHAWPLTVLIALGVIIAWRRSSLRWVLGTAAALGLLFIAANGFPTSAWRTMLLGPWYNDPWRLATLVSFGGFPLAVIGASAVAAITMLGIRRAIRMTQPREPRRSLRTLTAISVLFLLAATQGAGAHAGIQYVSDKYRFEDSSPLLSPDERALMERLPEHVPADAVIVNNPWNGGALAYALTGIRVMTPHTGGSYDPRITEMTSWLDYGLAESCDAANELDARYVLDFGTRYVFSGTPRAIPYAGISGVDPETSPVLTEIDREGDAVLYEITGCE